MDRRRVCLEDRHLGLECGELCCDKAEEFKCWVIFDSNSSRMKLVKRVRKACFYFFLLPKVKIYLTNIFPVVLFETWFLT